MRVSDEEARFIASGQGKCNSLERNLAADLLEARAAAEELRKDAERLR